MLCCYLLGLLLGAVVGLWPFQQPVPPVPGETVLKGRLVTAANRHEFTPEDFPTAYFRPRTGQCLLALGFTGGRLDHTLSVLNAMVRYPEQPVVLVDEDDASFVAGAGRTMLELEVGTRISVMPVGAARPRATTERSKSWARTVMLVSRVREAARAAGPVNRSFDFIKGQAA